MFFSRPRVHFLGCLEVMLCRLACRVPTEKMSIHILQNDSLPKKRLSGLLKARTRIVAVDGIENANLLDSTKHFSDLSDDDGPICIVSKHVVIFHCFVHLQQKMTVNTLPFVDDIISKDHNI
jgi:hypothetical protein